MSVVPATQEPVGLTAKVGYAGGNFGKSLIWTSLDYFLLFFLTDLWGLSPFQAGLVVTIALVWDGLCGPLIGYVIDRVNTPFGRYGAYLLFGAPLCALAYWMVLHDPGWRRDSLVWYAMIAGLIFRTAYTICDVPHNALMAKVSRGSRDAALLSGLRLMFSALGGLTVAFAAGLVFASPDRLAQGERISAFAIWAGAGYVVALWVSWLATRRIDRPTPSPPPGAPPVRRLAALLRHSMLGVLLTVTFVQVATVSVFTRSIAYFGDRVIEDEGWASRAMILITLAQGLSMPAWIAIAQRLDKRTVLVLAYGTLALALIAFMLTVHSLPGARLPLIGLIGATMGGCGFAIWAMLPDTIEHGEWRGGARVEALSTALFLLVLKWASGLSATLLAVPLSLADYEQRPRGDPVVSQVIVGAMSLIPLAGLGLCALLLVFYDLGHQRNADIRSALDRQR